MSKQHTPLPWAEQEMPHGRNDRITADDGEGTVICEFPYGLDANAAFIVQACNAHDDLVAALTATLPALEKSAAHCAERQSEVERVGPVCGCFSHRTLRAARAALAKVSA